MERSIRRLFLKSLLILQFIFRYPSSNYCCFSCSDFCHGWRILCVNTSARNINITYLHSVTSRFITCAGIEGRIKSNCSNVTMVSKNLRIFLPRKCPEIKVQTKTDFSWNNICISAKLTPLSLIPAGCKKLYEVKTANDQRNLRSARKARFSCQKRYCSPNTYRGKILHLWKEMLLKNYHLL